MGARAPFVEDLPFMGRDLAGDATDEASGRDSSSGLASLTCDDV